MKLSHPADGHTQDATPDAVDVSIVVPMYNEEDSVVPLYREIAAVMDAGAYRYEAIFISDGSTDATVDNLREASKDDPRVTILELMRNFGQTAATAAGFDTARGAVIVPMDGDGQNDPADIPALVAKLDENGEKPGAWDIVSGWRKNRQDKLMSRRLPSIIANRLVKRLTWTTEIHDFGCSLKAYRRQVLEDVKIYGEMHRFLPAICKWRGARITEQVVNHRAREHGASKYNLKRTFKVLLDLLTVKFLGDYLAKPLYFFGKLATITMGLAAIAFVIAIFQRFGFLTEHDGATRFNDNILVFFAMTTLMIAVIFLMMGVLSELMARIYHESQDRKPYKVRHTFVGETPQPGDADQANPPAQSLAS
ncbi:MAG: glycosyltransferase family 2 protein [Planctomycetota bacterium]